MILYFASESAPSEGGIAALGLNIKAFVFQLITFAIIVYFLNKFVLKKLFKVIDERQKEIEAGLERSRQAQDELDKATGRAEGIIKDARGQANDILHSAQGEASQLLKETEAKAAQKAERIVLEARSQLGVDIEKAHKDLLKQNAKLISQVAAEIIGQKLTSDQDSKLIDKALEAK
jgi:F-type H+-transporting ATPase subunit b